MLIAGLAVLGATVVGGSLGLYAGFKGGAFSTLLLRIADVIMSFPTLLLAVIVLFVFEPGVVNVIIVLAISRIPIFLRTVRAEVLELRQRMFVTSALAMGASTWRILFLHIAPMVMPTVINLAALELAYIMLAEIGPELPRHRHPAARGHLGPDGGRRPQLHRLRLVAGLLAGPRDHAGDDVAQPLLQLAAHRDRPGRAVAAPDRGGMIMANAPLLEVKNLSIEFPTKRGTVKAVDGVSWTVDQGETLAILGESGSGKSVSSSAVMDLIDTPPAVISSGEILLRGVDLLQMPQAERQKVNGKTISMIFQDPLAALNPVYPIGWQIAETMRVHGIDQVTARRRVMELLARVGIADPERRARDYPHEFSGGQRQRIMIASAIALKPDLLIADEPTSALDVTVEAQVLDLLKEIQRESGMGLVIITHNLSVVERIADRVVVMQAGRIVESGPVAEVMSAPSHPYTRKLLDSVPGRHGFSVAEADAAGQPSPCCASSMSRRSTSGGRSCSARRRRNSCARWTTPASPWRAARPSASSASPGRANRRSPACCSGSTRPTEGTIEFEGKDLTHLSAAETFQVRRRMQFVFQDPTASLNPRMTIQQIISEPWAIHQGVLPREAWRARVAELLDKVGLKPEHADRHPHQFSGGQRQRIAIARSLALNPDLIICDEAVSALDVSIQAQVIDLLKDLRRELGLSYVFIAHDLALVRDFATSVIVMYQGRIVEQGTTEAVYGNPQHDYTRRLLTASGGHLGSLAA